MQKKYNGFFWLAKIFGCEPNGSAKKIPSASLDYRICPNRRASADLRVSVYLKNIYI